MTRVLGAVLMVLVGLAGMQSAGAAQKVGQITVDANGIARTNSPVSASVDMELPKGQFILLPTGPHSGPSTPVEVERAGKSVTLYWIERDLKADQTRTYDVLTVDEKPSADAFHFVAGDNTRDLLFGQTPISRDMNKYDPADRADTFKPYTHVFAFDSADTFITKGPGGLYTHHRGIFFGFIGVYTARRCWGISGIARMSRSGM